MNLINKSQLAEQRTYFQKSQSNQRLTEAVEAHSERDGTASEVTIFLSHKHGENNEIKDAIALLSRLGVRVYVDWNDTGMPSTTSGLTAVRLKDRITKCRKFILLATEAAIQSKWCNWELGYGDAKKYIEHIAILPIRNDGTNFSGTEYLQIYPVINLSYSWNDEKFEVKFPDGSSMDLERWLRS